MDTSVPKMEARAAAADAPRVAPARQRPAPEAKDPFRLGFRERLTTTPDGREVFVRIPLTAEDLVYPEEGDHVAQGMPHFSLLHPWAEAMRCYLEKRPGLVVTSDVLLKLRHDGKTSGPDVAVIEGDFDPDEIEGGIHLEDVGGRLVFAFEVVSTSEPEIEDKDLTKNPQRYAAEGVEEYFTVYPQPGRKVSDLVGRRLGPAGEYVEIAPDAEGRVMSERLGLVFSIDAETEKLVVADARTGQRLRILEEEEAARVEAERRLAKEAEARRQAEAEKNREAEARRQAEKRAEQEAEARRRRGFYSPNCSMKLSISESAAFHDSPRVSNSATRPSSCTVSSATKTLSPWRACHNSPESFCSGSRDTEYPLARSA